MTDTAIWVWVPGSGEARRLDRVIFVQEFTTGMSPSATLITLSARTRYRLSINGTILGSGPARSYPESREADTFNLTPFLRPGNNRIEVEVLHEGTASYHHLQEPPGFIAWGDVMDANGPRHSLVTPGTWRCRRLAGIDTAAPALSFAQGPIEARDFSAEAMASGQPWAAPIPATPTVTPLLTREIPALTRLPQIPANIRSAPVQDTETLVGAWISELPVSDHPGPAQHQRAAARGWIYSPRAQTVRLGSWWGDYWFNGQLIPKADDRASQLRQVMDAPLQAGWNRFAAIGELVYGYWEFCLAWPTEAGLFVSTTPAQDPGSSQTIAFTGPVPARDLEACVPELVQGGTVAGLAWRDQPLTAQTCPPLRKLAWSRPATPAATVSLPLTLPGKQDTLVTADMGKITLGPIALDIEGPAGTVVAIGHGEQCGEDGRPNYAKTVTYYGADRFILPGGRHRVETFSPRGLRHLDLLVSNHGAPVTLHGASVVETRYPYSFSGSFECSDPGFNQLWAFGRRTLELCSEDVLTDCPWRERTLYGGDLLAEMAVSAVLTPDRRLVKRCLGIFLDSYNPDMGWLQSMAPIPAHRIPLAEYPLLVAIATGWYLRLSNDQEFARRAWPVFRQMTGAAERMRRPDGSYSPPWPAFIDHGRTVIAGPTAAFNAVLVSAFRAFAETAIRAGDEAGAQQAARLASDLEARLPSAYLDTASGCFRDLPLHEGGRETEGSPALVWPLLFAPALRSTAPAVLPALRDILKGFTPDNEPNSISPYQMFYLLALLRELGEAELAEDTIRRVYAPMLENPTGTIWEHAKPDTSLTHAWSCAINDYFATAVLGVRLGFESAEELKTIRVCPSAATLEWAKGKVPHPLGIVSVEWRRTGNRLAIAVEAPKGVPVEILPAGPLAKLDRIL